jgi:hypothetical protein
MYTIKNKDNTYTVGIITITSNNKEVYDFGSQNVPVFEVGNASSTKFQGIVGAVYTVNLRKDEIDNFVMSFNRKDYDKIGGNKNADIIAQKAADFINKKQFVQFNISDNDYKNISIEFLKMVNFVEGQRKSIILYKEKNKDLSAIENENKELIPSDHVNTIPEE